MKFFIHEPSVPYSKVWQLVRGVGSEKHKGENKSLEFLEETINSAISGTLDLEQENFNISGYDYIARLNESRRARPKDMSMYISSDMEVSDNGRAPEGTVSESKVLGTIDNGLNIVEDEETIRLGIRSLVQDTQIYGRSIGINPVESLKGLLDGNPDSVENIRKLCDAHPEVLEVFADIAESLISYAGTGEDTRDKIYRTVDEEEKRHAQR